MTTDICILAMAGVATVVVLTDEERNTLESWLRKRTTEQRMGRRARILLAAAAGKTTKEVATSLRERPAAVSTWRTRFARHGLSGLPDAPRPGKRRVYGEATERRILALLDQPPPEGSTTWTGGLVAQALGDVSAGHVWRVLARHGVHFQRRRSWYLITDTGFAQKAADIVGLYMHPPENAVAVSVNDEPSIQALRRAQGWLRLPNGKAMRGHTHEYKRHGINTLFAALQVHTGLVHVGHYCRKRRREFLDSTNGVVAQHPETKLYVILENLSTHKPKHDRWLARHPLVHFHYTCAHASWLNQIEVWFRILTRAVLRGLSATDPRQVCRAIDRLTAGQNEHPVQLEWTKTVVHPGKLKHHCSDLRR